MNKQIGFRQWRIVKQRRKLGKPYWLQDGSFQYYGLMGTRQWETRQEWDFNTREQAVEALKQMPLTWGGDRSAVLKEGK